MARPPTAPQNPSTSQPAPIAPQGPATTQPPPSALQTPTTVRPPPPSTLQPAVPPLRPASQSSLLLHPPRSLQSGLSVRLPPPLTFTPPTTRQPPRRRHGESDYKIDEVPRTEDVIKNLDHKTAASIESLGKLIHEEMESGRRLLSELAMQHREEKKLNKEEAKAPQDLNFITLATIGFLVAIFVVPSCLPLLSGDSRVWVLIVLFLFCYFWIYTMMGLWRITRSGCEGGSTEAIMGTLRPHFVLQIVVLFLLLMILIVGQKG